MKNLFYSHSLGWQREIIKIKKEVKYDRKIEPIHQYSKTVLTRYARNGYPKRS
ncbi:MAG: hypothetical protein HN692_00985 [Candidatus Cloacimonetes bacterium]|nr:hypothetical protein [Candidatus Cloacimonadota bacterium]